MERIAYASAASCSCDVIAATCRRSTNDVILRAGQLVDVAGNPPLMPFYATLTYDRRW